MLNFRSVAPLCFSLTAMLVLAACGDGTNTETEVRIYPDAASTPDPTSGATDVALELTLAWSGPSDAVSYDVYVGTDAIDISADEENGTSFEGNTTTTSWDLTGLAEGTTYYWRVDTQFDDGISVGRLWSFSTPDGPGAPPAVATPDPANEATDVALDAALAWGASTGATSYDVYFGESATAVLAATNDDGPFAGNVTDATWTPSGMVADATYFWRVDAVGNNGTTAGTLWSFKTVSEDAPARATAPTPAAGAEDVAVDATLTWTGDDAATAFDLYVTLTLADATADVPNNTIRTGQLTEARYVPDTPFDLGRTVYWRVDTVAQGGTTRGVVWSFDTVTPALPLAAVPVMPTNGETDVPTDTMFGWEAGDGATEFEVYLAVEGEELESVATTSDSSWVPDASLLASTTYVWRVDSRNDVGTVAGEVTTFDTAAPTPRPYFRGVELALAVGTDGLLVGWSDARDDVTPGSEFEYAVYVAADADSIDWEAPTAIVTGDNRTVLDATTIGSPAAGSTIAVGVRASDADGNSDGNGSIITAWIPDAETRIYVDAAAADGGDGALGTPFNSMAEVATAINASTDESIAVIAAAGEYTSEITLTTEASVRFIGGFGTLADEADATLLDAFGPWSTPTVWAMPGAVTNGLLDLGDGTFDVVGMTFDGYRGQAIVGGHVDLLLMATRFSDGLRYEGDPDDFFSGARDSTALFLQGTGEPVAIDVVGCRFVDLNDGILVDLPLSHIGLHGNDLQNVDGALIGSEYENPESGYEEFRTDVGGGFSATVEGNTGWRTQSYLNMRLATAADDAARAFDVLAANNRVRGVRDDFIDLQYLGGLGSGAAIDIEVRDNQLWSSDDDILRASFYQDDDDLGETVWPEFSSLRVVGADNRLLHGNSEMFTITNAVPSSGGTVDIVIERNTLNNTEGEMLEYSGSYVDESDFERLETRDDFTINITVQDNIAWGTDGMIEFRNLPISMTGEMNVLITNNYCSGTGESVDWSSISWWWDREAVDERAFDVSVEISNNTFISEEDGIQIRGIDLTGGEMLWDISNNEIDVADVGITLESQDFGEDADLDSPNYLSALADTHATYRVHNNVVNSVDDSLSATVFGGTEGSVFDIRYNDFLSLEDQAVDIDFADLGIVMHHNTFEAVDDDGVRLYAAQDQFEGHSLVSVFDNRVGPVESEVFDFSVEEALESVAQRELDLWIANNSLQDSNESDSVDLTGLRNTLALLERNIMGRADVDSDEALGFSCNAASVGIQRNNILWDAGGDGLEVRRCGFETWNSTIGNSAGSSTSDTGVTAHSEQFFVANSIVSGNAGEGDFDEYSSPPVFTFFGNGWLPGFGSIVGDEAYAGCVDPLDILECARMAAWAPTWDAGHPDARFNDTDGSRNDMGAWGGPHAGTIGHLEGEPAAPLALIGLRPLADLNAGASLLDPSSAITLVFNQDVDSDSVSGAVAMTSFDGTNVTGTFEATGNRVVFTPTSDLADGTHYEVSVSTDVMTAEGQPLGVADFRYVTTQTATVTDAAEPNDSDDVATTIASDVFAIEDSLDPYGFGGTVDITDVYAVELNAGERLVANVELETGDSTPTAYLAVSSSTHGLISWAHENLSDNSDELHGQSFVDFVAPEDGTYFLTVLPNAFENDAQEEWPVLTLTGIFGGDGADEVITYALTGMVRALAP